MRDYEDAITVDFTPLPPCKGELRGSFLPSRFRRGSPEGRGEGFSKAPFGGWGTSRPTVYGGIINLYDEELKGANKALMHLVSSSKKSLNTLLPIWKTLISFLCVILPVLRKPTPFLVLKGLRFEFTHSIFIFSILQP